MKVSGAYSATLVKEIPEAQSLPFQALTEDILSNEDENIYVISASDITDANLEHLTNVLKAKKSKKLVIVITQTAAQTERVRQLSSMGIDNFTIISNPLPDLIVDNIVTIIKSYSIKYSREFEGTKATDEHTRQVDLKDIALAYSYTPGYIPINEEVISAGRIPILNAVNRTDTTKAVENMNSNFSSNEQEKFFDTSNNKPSEALKLIKDAAVHFDTNKLEKEINLESILNELQRNSAEYSNHIATINIIDDQINAIIMNPRIPKSQKFDEIINLLKSKQLARTKAESLETKRFIEIIESVAASSQDKIYNIISAVEDKYASKSIKELYESHSLELQKLTQERFEELMKLNNVILSLNKTLNVLDTAKADMLRKLAKEGLTVSDAYNAELRPIIGTLPSIGVMEMAEAIINAGVEAKANFETYSYDLKTMMNSIFKLGNIDESIAKKTDYLNKLLVANRIEERVIIDSPVKAALRLVVGCKDTGRTTYAHITTKLASRSHNACLIDMTLKSKLYRYTDVTPISEIISSDVVPRMDYLALYRDEIDISNIKIMDLLKRLTSEYKIITVLIPDNDKETYDFLVNEALSVTFVVNDTDYCVEAMSKFTEGISLSNTAILLADMYTDLTPIELEELYKIDTDMVRVIKVPRLSEIRMATNQHKDPLSYEVVKLAYQGLI